MNGIQYITSSSDAFRYVHSQCVGAFGARSHVACTSTAIRLSTDEALSDVCLSARFSSCVLLSTRGLYCRMHQTSMQATMRTVSWSVDWNTSGWASTHVKSAMRWRNAHCRCCWRFSFRVRHYFCVSIHSRLLWSEVVCNTLLANVLYFDARYWQALFRRPPACGRRRDVRQQLLADGRRM